MPRREQSLTAQHPIQRQRIELNVHTAENLPAGFFFDALSNGLFRVRCHSWFPRGKIPGVPVLFVALVEAANFQGGRVGVGEVEVLFHDHPVALFSVLREKGDFPGPAVWPEGRGFHVHEHDVGHGVSSWWGVKSELGESLAADNPSLAVPDSRTGQVDVLDTTHGPGSLAVILDTTRIVPGIGDGRSTGSPNTDRVTLIFQSGPPPVSGTHRMMPTCSSTEVARATVPEGLIVMVRSPLLMVSGWGVKFRMYMDPPVVVMCREPPYTNT
jgi:hypothetical protein